MPNPNAPAADADTGDARDEGYSSVASAVAELERRDRERAAAAKKAKAAPAEDIEDDPTPARGRSKAAPDDQAEDDDAEEDRRQVDAAEDDEDEGEDKPKRRAKKADESSDDNDGEDAGEDAEDDDGESVDDDQAEDGEEEEVKPKEPKAPAKVKISLGDREVEATPDEVSAYLREGHAERQQMAQARQHIAQQAQTLQQQGQMLAQIAQAMLGQEPALELAQSDPGAYIAHQAQYRQRMEVLQQLQGHMQQASQIAQAQQQQAFAQTVERERAALLKAMPELADPAKLSAFQGRIAKVAQRYGLTAQDLSGAFDHRSYLMLRDLGRLADMEAERGRVREKLKGAPPLKTPEQRASSAQRGPDGKHMKAKSAFMKSGRTMRDVRAYLAATER